MDKIVHANCDSTLHYTSVVDVALDENTDSDVRTDAAYSINTGTIH